MQTDHTTTGNSHLLPILMVHSADQSAYPGTGPMKHQLRPLLLLLLALFLAAISPLLAVAADPATVRATLLNVRAGASSDSPILATLPRSAAVAVEAVEGDWARVTLVDGSTGYVAVRFLELPAALAPSIDLVSAVPAATGAPHIATAPPGGRAPRRAVFSGRVISVADGDTVTVLNGSNEQVRVRLANIDAPEDGQPWGRRSRQLLSELVAGQTVEIIERDTDRYGRIVADIYLGDTYINGQMVILGGAWAFRQYLNDQRLVEWEETARNSHTGLWAMPPGQIVAPWDYRATRRAQAAGITTGDGPTTSTPQRAPAGSVQCGSKRTCGEMSSCAEARAFLSQCGLSRLDGDGDGIPCESLCRR
jgi:endonuclease YncB( thermonuclease family)